MTKREKELKKVVKELNNPVIETEEKTLTEEESVAWMSASLNKRIHDKIREFFKEDDTRSPEEYEMKLDNQ